MKDTPIPKGKMAAAKGFANENRLLAALLERGYNASRVDLPHSTYDIVVEKSAHDIIRIQVKTVGISGSIPFTGGIRGGIDREYKSKVKEYTQSTKTSDIVVGVESISDNGEKEINFYFIPTLYIEEINQKSISIRKILQTKNNWEILLSCKNKKFIDKIFGISRAKP